MTIFLLIASLAALLCGPLLYALASRHSVFLAFLDGFVLVSVAGLVLLEVIPGTFGSGGTWSLAFLIAGALGPSLIESTLERARREAHLATLVLAMLGLWLHSVADGAALAPSVVEHGHHQHGHGEALAVSIVIHSIPVGLMVWWLMAPVFGNRWPAITLLLMCAGTIAGFVFGDEVGSLMGASGFAWFQALVAGSILHVVFGRPHLDETAGGVRPADRSFEGLGNLVALAALYLLARIDPHTSALFGVFESTRTVASAIGLPLIAGVAISVILLKRAMRIPCFELFVPAMLSVFQLGFWLTAVWVAGVVLARHIIFAERVREDAKNVEHRSWNLGSMIDELAPWTVAAVVMAGLVPEFQSLVAAASWPGWLWVALATVVIGAIRIHPVACVILASALVESNFPTSLAVLLVLLGPLPSFGGKRNFNIGWAVRIPALLCLALMCLMLGPYLDPAQIQEVENVDWQNLILMSMALPCLWSLLRLGGRGWMAQLMPIQAHDHRHA